MVEQLIRMYPSHDTADLAAMFGLSPQQVALKAASLGVRKTPEFIARLQQEQIEKIKKYQYKAGDTSWNKGKKGLIPITDAMRSSMFRKGHTPLNTKFDGCVVVRPDKRGVPQKFIRVSAKRWESLARWNYRHHIGPISKGKVIRFRDGDSLNCEPENLECITNTLNMLLNSKRGYSRPVAEVKEVICHIKKEIKERHEKQDE